MYFKFYYISLQADCKYEVSDGWADTLFLHLSDNKGEDCGFTQLGIDIEWMNESFDEKIISRTHIFDNETEAIEFVSKWQDGVGLDENKDPVLKNIKARPLAVPFYYQEDSKMIGYVVGGWALKCSEES